MQDISKEFLKGLLDKADEKSIKYAVRVAALEDLKEHADRYKHYKPDSYAKVDISFRYKIDKNDFA